VFAHARIVQFIPYVLEGFALVGHVREEEEEEEDTSVQQNRLHLGFKGKIDP